MKYGFFTAAAASPHIDIADCESNVSSCIECVKTAVCRGARLVVLSELCLTGYTCGDLFLQGALIRAAESALQKLATATSGINALIIAGLPLSFSGALYNTAAVILRGRVIAIIPKTYIPNYGEFYEMRHFTSAMSLHGDEKVHIGGYDVPFGSVIVQDEKDPRLAVSVEICEDLWAPLPPSTIASLCGSSVIANLSCSNEVIGKAAYRRLLVQGQSSRLISAYIYADAGRGESTSDMVFGAHNIIAQNGTVLDECAPFSGRNIAIASIDIERLDAERRRMTTFAQCAAAFASLPIKKPRVITCDIASGDDPDEIVPSPYPLLKMHPFVPENMDERGKRCHEVLTMQAEGLIQRLSAIYAPHIDTSKVVVGLSGGLDSTLALLVSCKAFDALHLPRQGITAVTMPCYGTTSRTLNNALSLAHEMGTSIRKIDITCSVKQHLSDVGIGECERTASFENAQARERTQVLMDIANNTGGIVIGTGDLSELALGWCTYNGDHMSMYGVNASIPKTLVRHLVAFFADESEAAGKDKASSVLRDILATPVSPELLPPDEDGNPQNTEKAVGPYELHDFFLYYTLRFGFAPDKVLFLAEASGLPYARGEIVKWMKVFFRRFFAQQFKRNALPDGAKVGTLSLSPRGDWRMPSDARARQWLEEVEKLERNA